MYFSFSEKENINLLIKNVDFFALQSHLLTNCNKKNS